MHKLVVGVTLSLCLLFVATLAFAGSPHFTSCIASTDGNTLTVDGKIAGLGDEAQVHIVATASAQCINPGDNHPKAANKESVTAAGDFPIQNGKALFSLDVTATFTPNCAPPMSVLFIDVTACDVKHGICCTL